ncbi:MAG: hypothetical protein ACK4R2_09265 [Roseateles sp.]
MTRYLFVSPDSNTPTGGVKVIYKHAELLRSLGVDAHVMHFQRPFRCDWFENTASIVYFDELRTTDMLMVPEIMTIFGTQLASIGMRYCMYVQNGYLVLPTAPLQEVWNCYRNATAILSISEDTSSFLGSVFPEFAHKIVRVKYSIDTTRFGAPALPDSPPRAKKCTFMPRKLPLHSSNLVPWLARAFPDWTFQPIHNMTEAQVAAELQSSRVFLAFSDFEGCPVPPLEAAISGNVVVGYPGWGGQEYWAAPNFLPVPVGDMRAFVAQFRVATGIALRPDAPALLAPGIERLQVDYGLATETALLQQMVQRVQALAAAQAAQAAPAPAAQTPA